MCSAKLGFHRLYVTVSSWHTITIVNSDGLSVISIYENKGVTCVVSDAFRLCSILFLRRVRTICITGKNQLQVCDSPSSRSFVLQVILNHSTVNMK